jgi:hypothetical protein
MWVVPEDGAGRAAGAGCGLVATVELPGLEGSGVGGAEGCRATTP